jgi:hypothetical protein
MLAWIADPDETRKPVYDAAPMRSDRAVGEIGAPASDRAGILQERLELRSEDRVAVIDRVLRRRIAPRRVSGGTL